MLLMEAFRKTIRDKHLARSTEKTYRKWIIEFLTFYKDGENWVSPRELGHDKVEAWLSHLANFRGVKESTHDQAFYAILFLYNQVLQTPLENLSSDRPKKPKNIPVVLSKDETWRLLGGLKGVNALIAQLMYGCGLRVSEATSLRLKDIDTGNRMLSIWHSKHKQSRTVPLPERLVEPIGQQIQSVMKLVLNAGWRKRKDHCT